MTVRAFIKFSVGAALGALLCAERIPQVAAFLFAAGFRRWRLSGKGYGPSGKSADWPQASQLSIPATRLNPRLMISYHPEYHEFDPKRVDKCLGFCGQLGVGWIRTDIRWNQLIPNGAKIDLDALSWYRKFLTVVAWYGLRSFVVLSSPPTAVLRQNGRGRLESWGQFVRIAVGELGSLCSGYQLMNEPNTPVYGFLSFEDSVDAFVDGASIIHSAFPNAPVAVNISLDIWDAKRHLNQLLDRTGSAINIIGIDHYPGTWTIGRNDPWAAVSELADKIESAKPGSAWFKRQLAIMETGYSSNSILRDFSKQALYFRGLNEMIGRLRLKSPKRLALLGIYELCDGDSRAWLDPEAHFGIMTSDLRPKPAFAQISELAETL